MDEEEKRQFGAWLRYWRNKNGMTQKDLAQKLKIRDSLLSLYERGRYVPNLGMVQRIIRGLNLSRAAFFGKE